MQTQRTKNELLQLQITSFVCADNDDLKSHTEISKLYQFLRKTIIYRERKWKGLIACVSKSKDYDIILWDVNKEKEMKRLRGHTDRVSQVIPLRDGNIASCSSYDMTLRIWDWIKGCCVRQLDLSEEVNTLI